MLLALSCAAGRIVANSEFYFYNFSELDEALHAVS